MTFLDWVRMVEIPVWIAMASLLGRHIWHDSQAELKHAADLASIESTLKDRITDDAKVIANAAVATVRLEAERDLANYKLEVMRQFASVGALQDMETRITRHIDAIDQKIDRLIEQKEDLR